MSIAVSEVPIIEQANRRPTISRWVPLIAFALVAAPMIRVSLIPTLVGEEITPLLFAAYIAAIGVMIVAIGGSKTTKMRLAVIPFALAVLASAFDAIQPRDALHRSLFLLAVVYSIGPGLHGPLVSKLHIGIRNSFRGFAIVIVALAFFWALFGLPNLGRGGFSGPLGHSMMLGPVTVFAGIFTFTKFMTGHRYWGFAAAICMCLCCLTVSRIAMASLVAGVITVAAIKSRKHVIPQVVLGLTIIACLVNSNLVLKQFISLLPADKAEYLLLKIESSHRDSHWEARLEEFSLDPWTGLGVMQALPDSPGWSEEGGVEAGSGHLMILSMTGILGAAGLLLVLSCGTHLLFRVRNKIDETWLLETLGLSAAFCVHATAEGYLFAAGSPLCLFFWHTVASLYCHPAPTNPRRLA